MKVEQRVLKVLTGPSHTQLVSKRVKQINKLNKEMDHRRAQSKAALLCVED